MAYSPYRKGTLLIPTGGTKHLFIIVTDRCDEGCHLLVNLSTVKGGFHDQTCILEPGCHRFISEKSYAVYRLAEIQPATRLSKMVDGWVYSTHDDASEDLANQIMAGVCVSPHTPRRIKNYIGC